MLTMETAFWNEFDTVLGYMPIKYTPEMSNCNYSYYKTHFAPNMQMTRDKYMEMAMRGEDIELDQSKPYYKGKFDCTRLLSGNWHRATHKQTYVKMLKFIKSCGRAGCTYHRVCEECIKKPVGYDRETFLTMRSRFLEAFDPKTGLLNLKNGDSLTRTSYFCLNQFGNMILEFADSNEPISDLEEKFEKVLRLVEKEHKTFAEASIWLMMHDGACITSEDVKYWLGEVNKFYSDPKFGYFKSRLYRYRKFLTDHAAQYRK